MRKTTIAALAVSLMFAGTSAFAWDSAAALSVGKSTATAQGAGASLSGGTSAFGANNGTSFVRNESSAGQLSVSRSAVTFTETDGFTVNRGQSSPVDGMRTFTNITNDVDGIDVTMVNEAFTDGFDESRTTVRDRGQGTESIGGAVATRSGNSWSEGAYVIRGTASW